MPRVLVIEDEKEIRSIVKHHLVNENYEVIEAEDGEKAIQMINEGDNPLEVAAVICDIRMPKINGVEAISYFQREYPTLPLVVITGFPNANMAVDLLKKGVKDYMVKPVEKQVLLSTVKKAVQERSMRVGFSSPSLLP